MEYVKRYTNLGVRQCGNDALTLCYYYRMWEKKRNICELLRHDFIILGYHNSHTDRDSNLSYSSWVTCSRRQVDYRESGLRWHRHTHTRIVRHLYVYGIHVLWDVLIKSNPAKITLSTVSPINKHTLGFAGEQSAPNITREWERETF